MMVPELVRIESIEHHTDDVFTLVLSHEKKGQRYPFLPGQFNMLYLHGFGEVAISICGDAQKDEGLVHTIQAVGNVTNGMQKLKVGDELGVRGPFGTNWPLQKKGVDVLLIAGGLGLPSLRPALLHFEAHLKDYNRISLLYGARSCDRFLYADDLSRWKKKGIEIKMTVDRGKPSWKGDVGVVTTLLPDQLKRPKETVAFICGPEVMIRASVEALKQRGVESDTIYISMERNMQCGVGFCGHCQFGPYFLCKDGPVFSYSQLQHWFDVHEL